MQKKPICGVKLIDEHLQELEGSESEDFLSRLGRLAALYI